MNVKNEGVKNLIPLPQQTKEKQREIQSKGGKKSGEVRRKKKAFAETFREVLDMRVKKGSPLDKTLSEKGINLEKNSDVQTAMIAGLVVSATRGNVNAYQAIKEAIGESSGECRGEDSMPVKIPAELLGKMYVDINRHISNGTIKEAIIKGGRGSLKSSFPGLKIPELIMANPSIHGLCMRNVKDTLKDSVYEQIKWGIEKLGVADRFKCTTSPLKIVYQPTGQTIYFRGADDPIKIKSIKPPFGYIGVLWFEEFDQYAGEAAIRNIRQSAIRGTDEKGNSGAVIFETFNPPPTAQAWANRYVADIESRMGTENEKKGTEVLHTNYTDAPREWLGDDFLQEAEDLKKNNPRAYANEYGGEITGTGGNVFENLEIRDLTDEEVNNFDKIKQGLDWGYFPDPTAFVRLQYDAANMTVYIYDEQKRVKTGNETLVEVLKDFNRELTIADNAEEKSIAYFRENGFNIRACVKGPGSVDFGLKWLASRKKIVIDRRRCPETAKEFESYEYLKDREGNFISGYPDENNHFIDAVRYALNEEIMRSKARITNVRV